ncbi:MAG: riboflavin synthase [Deltaproteobacteria bacterium]|nr:riboflavin synthase [Deltaproteobacteria bacterium]
MFSGIVEESATVVSLNTEDLPYRLSVRSALDHTQTQLGDSIANDGVCLTVVGIEGDLLVFDVALETVRRTTLGQLKAGDPVHLERSLKVGDRISGHFVSGHVDATAELLKREKDGNYDKLTFSIPTNLSGMIAEKGSITIAGVSLTVGEVEANNFCVYLIPHTTEVTKFSKVEIGQSVNIEVDLIARYLKSLLDSRSHE